MAAGKKAYQRFHTKGAWLSVAKKQQEKVNRLFTRQTGHYHSGGTALEYDIFLPACGSGPHPALVLFFGGGWRVGSKEALHPVAQVMAENGIAAITPEYRIASKHHTTPQNAMDDGLLFWQLVQQHAGKWGLDAGRIALGGGSAGAQIAIMAALNSGTMPKAFVLYNPATNLTGLKMRLAMGGSYRHASPMHQIKSIFASTLILTGGADKITPPKLAQQFAAKVRQTGNSCRVVVYPGKKHGFFLKQNDEEAHAATNREILDFLATYL